MVLLFKAIPEPSTMDELNLKFPNLRFAYVPEFLREKDAIEWFNNPDRIVYSCRDNDESELLTYFGGYQIQSLEYECLISKQNLGIRP